MLIKRLKKQLSMNKGSKFLAIRFIKAFVATIWLWSVWVYFFTTKCIFTDPPRSVKLLRFLLSLALGSFQDVFSITVIKMIYSQHPLYPWDLYFLSKSPNFVIKGAISVQYGSRGKDSLRCKRSFRYNRVRLIGSLL